MDRHPPDPRQEAIFFNLRRSAFDLADPSLRKTGLGEPIDEMLEHCCVAEWLHSCPVADCEIRVADEEQFGRGARLVEPAELRKASRQETA